MPRATIARLGQDLERVLVAGAHLAPADPDLARDRAAIARLAEQLGAKAPAIAQLSEATARALGASAKEAPREVLSLLAMVSRVRSAQAAAAAPAGELEPLRAVPPIGTPCNARVLDDFHDALTKSGSGRIEKLEQAIETGQIADLRLVEAIVHATGDTYIGPTVTERAVPLLGPAIAQPIRARFKVKGGAVHGRRLRALVAVEKEQAAGLLAQAIEEGSPEVREAALDAIADHLRGDARFEATALAVLSSDRSASVRRAAVRALAGHASDAAFAALLEALDGGATRAAAAEALGASRHPDTVTRLLERLDQAARAARTPPKKSSKKDVDALRADALEMAGLLLRALASQADPRIPKIAMELVPLVGSPAAAAVVNSGTAAERAEIADALLGSDERLYPAAVDAARKLGEGEAFARFSAAMGKKDERRVLRLRAIEHRFEPPYDARWFDLCAASLRESKVAASDDERVVLVRMLGKLGDRRAVPILAALLQKPGNDLRRDVMEALGALGDPAAIDPIIATVARLARLGTDWWASWVARRALIAIGDPAAIVKVRAAYAEAREGTSEHSTLGDILRALAQHYPGH